MVADLYFNSVACEDQSSVWSSQQTNYAPMRSATAAAESRLQASSSSNNSSSSSSHASGRYKSSRRSQRSTCVVPDEMQNSINSGMNCSRSSTKTPAAGSACSWASQADTQTTVPFDSAPWNDAESLLKQQQQRQPPQEQAFSPCSRTPFMQCINGKSERSARRSAKDKSISSSAPSSVSARHEESSFYQRITEWDPSTTTPSSNSCNREVQHVKVATTECAKESSSSCCSSGSCSPALSAFDEPKQNSNSPNSPSLIESVVPVRPVDVDVEEAAVPAEVSSGVLPHTYSEEAAATPADAAPAATTVPVPSYITPRASYNESHSCNSASPGPSLSLTMADIVAALRSAPEDRHPFLDMDYQRHLRENVRVQEQLNHHVVVSFQNQLTGEQQAAAFKCLLNAAHRRQYQQCMSRDATERNAQQQQQQQLNGEELSGARAPSCAGRWGPRQRRLINRQWRMTAEQAECDLYREGLGAVQRNLSCMCLFNPDTDVRVYNENCNMREQRFHRQHKLLIRLQRQRVRGGNPYFLEDTQ
jgi:hypothetical protein